jgi:uncharacterized membrane protein YeaQ/YmgE (transglycosylase-associated protein family)
VIGRRYRPPGSPACSSRGDEGYGVIGTIIAGMVGAMVGGFVLGLITGEDIPTLFAAVVGAVIVVIVWKMGARRGAILKPIAGSRR